LSFVRLLSRDLLKKKFDLERPRDRLSFGFAAENRMVAPDHPNIKSAHGYPELRSCVLLAAPLQSTTE
jgi:hypothetical protein